MIVLLTQFMPQWVDNGTLTQKVILCLDKGNPLPPKIVLWFNKCSQTITKQLRLNSPKDYSPSENSRGVPNQTSNFQFFLSYFYLIRRSFLSELYVLMLQRDIFSFIIYLLIRENFTTK